MSFDQLVYGAGLRPVVLVGVLYPSDTVVPAPWWTFAVWAAEIKYNCHGDEYQYR